jgi:hypothetical protein
MVRHWAGDVEIVNYHEEEQLQGDVIMPPVHPGEIFLTEFLESLALPVPAGALDHVPAGRINEIVHASGGSAPTPHRA